MDVSFVRLQVLQTLLGVLGRDFVTEDVIRDVKKIQEELFPAAEAEESEVPF